jgi:hypothetical protein
MKNAKLLMLIYVFVILTISCKKSSNNADQNQSGNLSCKVIEVEGSEVKYDTNGNLKSFGDYIYSYSENRMNIDIGTYHYEFYLNSVHQPDSGWLVNAVNPADTSSFYFYYNTEDYLKRLVHKTKDWEGKIQLWEVFHDYEGKNRISTQIILNGSFYESFSYLYSTNIDTRTEFFEKAHFLDFMEFNYGLDAGKANLNLPIQIINSRNGWTKTYSISYQFANNTNVSREDYFLDGNLKFVLRYAYLCQ